MRLRTVCFSLFLVAHIPSIAHGQELATGDTIRLRAYQSTEPGPGWIEGAVVRLTPDTLWYRSRGSVQPMSFGNAQIERSTFRDHRWGGTQLGVLAGGVVGGLVGFLTFEREFAPVDCMAIFQELCPPPRQTNLGLVAGARGAAAGALIGGVVGWFVGRRAGRWETVELDPITTRAGALSLSLRIRR